MVKSGLCSTWNPGLVGSRSSNDINAPCHVVVGQNPNSRDSLFVGGGGVLVESSSHPKPRRISMNLGLATLGEMEGTDLAAGGSMMAQDLRRADRSRAEGSRHAQGWELEIYKGSAAEQDSYQMEDEVLKFDLGEEDSLHASRTLAVGVFHSQKGYNPYVLFADMLKALGNT
jgi:hypothetical protein